MTPEPMLSSPRQKAAALVYLLAFIACIPAANWMIGNAGTVCAPPHGPCLVPVWPWGPKGMPLMAPSGVLLIGLALVLRDMVQRRLGRAAALTAIVAGALLSGAVAPPPLVYASAAAFLLSELADFAVYTPLQSRGLVLAVLASRPTASCSCGWRSAASTTLRAKSSASSGWCWRHCRSFTGSESASSPALQRDATGESLGLHAGLWRFLIASV